LELQKEQRQGYEQLCAQLADEQARLKRQLARLTRQAARAEGLLAAYGLVAPPRPSDADEIAL